MTPERDSCPSAFRWPVRVYYEDTDAGGIVYYANYLKFMERARTEWLRAMGVDVNEWALRTGQGFVVRSAHLSFIKPGYLGDELLVSVEPTVQKKASVTVFQRVSNGSEALCKGDIRLAFVELKTMRPCALPEFMI
ncbi:MAG: tol-pal system-associated acyl-CoA thioesterase [Gammaproteobacteria bacterium]